MATASKRVPTGELNNQHGGRSGAKVAQHMGPATGGRQGNKTSGGGINQRPRGKGAAGN